MRIDSQLDYPSNSMLTRIMALRVLLADESTTIKKVFQLALQDYAVEVTPVTLGTDVAEVATKIKPDIIFADVLLQKKSGYDVATEIKRHDHLKAIPIVLVWSGFMEIDMSKFKNSGAEDHLEKPFDTKKLRTLIQKYVQKTRNHPLSEFLNFPQMPEFKESPSPTDSKIDLDTTAKAKLNQVEKPEVSKPVKSYDPSGGVNLQPEPNPPNEPIAIPRVKNDSHLPPIPKEVTNPDTGAWSMDSFTSLESLSDSRNPATQDLGHTLESDDSIDEFMEMELPPEPPRPKMGKSKVQLQIENELENKNPTIEDDSAGWVNQDLDRYNLPPDKQKDSIPKIQYQVPEEKIDPKTVLNRPPDLPIKSRSKDSDPAEPSVRVKSPTNIPSGDDDEELELDLSQPEDSNLYRNFGESRVSEKDTGIAVPKMDPQQLEKIIRAQSQEVIEKVVWQIVPEIATRIIERELERLLKERSPK